MTTPKHGSGADIYGPLKFAGSQGTSNSIVTGGAAAQFTEFAGLKGTQWGGIGPLSRTQRGTRKLLVVGFGDSNWLGKPASNEIDLEGADRPHPKVFEVSRGINIASLTHNAPVAGELMRLREPTQDHLAVTNGPQLHALKRAVELDPGIEEIAILTGAINASGLVGVTTTDPGDQGDFRTTSDWAYNDPTPDATLATLIGEANDFLEAHPDYECGWLACSVGSISAFNGETDDAFEAAFQATIDYMRATITTAANAVVTISTPRPQLVATNLDKDGGADAGTFPEITERILGFNAIDPLVAPVDTSDLDDASSGDPRHHEPYEYRIIGRRHAEEYVRLAATRDRSTDRSIRMVYDPLKGRFADANGSGCRILEELVEWDGTMGMCLRADPSLIGGSINGFQTDIPINNAAHTLFMRLKLASGSVAATTTLLSGKTPGQSSFGRLVTLFRTLYQGTVAGTEYNLQSGGANAYSTNVWHSFALRFTGTAFSVWRDGVKIVTESTVGAAILTEPSILEIFDYEDGTGTAVDGLATDIRVTNYAATDAEIEAWHDDLPPVSLPAPSSLVAPDLIGSAINLGDNPTTGAAGNDWKNQLKSGLYQARYSGALNLPSDRDLPWDSNVYSGNINALAPYKFELHVTSEQAAWITATSLGVSTTSTNYIIRQWTALLSKAVAATEWGFSGTDANWTEVGPYVADADGDIRVLEVDGTGVATYPIA